MDTDNKTAIFYITDNGLNLAERLKGLYPEAYISKFKPETITGIWEEYRRIIFIMATGIVVRTIAPLIKDKRIDPAVIVLDEKEEYAISLLSGHLGGANKIAREIAGFLGGQAVVTTASDVNNLPAIDLWARENGLIIENWDIIPQVVTRFLNNNTLRIYSEIDIKLSKEFFMVDNPQYADMLITNKKEIGLNVIPVKTGIQKKKTKELDSCFRRNDEKQTIYQFYLRPKNLIVGIGCNSGTSAGEIEDAVKRVLAEKNFSFLSIHSVATIDIKADEKGLNEFVRAYGFSIKTFAADELNSLKGIQKSALVFKTTGAYAVAEPAALLASGSNNVLVPKQKIGNVTVAVAELRSEHRAKNMEQRQKGKLYIVGTGPGGIAHITPYAQNAIRKSDVIVGYSTYLDLIQGLIKDKE
ncbi:MAG: cobalamin biosynthesis protein [Nitrospirae bacterium]|nr:cobalamin biosynthesis protein [Nitrospirota bacterium]